MTINKTTEGNKMALNLEGRLDTTTAPQLEAVVKNELGGVSELVMDFEKLDRLQLVGQIF